MNLAFLILLGFVSAVPIGPSLYELFQFNIRSDKFRMDLLLTYLFADILHIALAWSLASYITSPLIANGLLICAAIFMMGSAFRLWNQYMPTGDMEAFSLPGHTQKFNPGSDISRIFFLTITNPAIFLFYLSLFSKKNVGFPALVVLLASFILSLIFLMISTKKSQNFFSAHKAKFNKGMAILFSIIAFNFLSQLS